MGSVPVIGVTPGILTWGVQNILMIFQEKQVPKYLKHFADNYCPYFLRKTLTV